jgi:hypothetical protein
VKEDSVTKEIIPFNLADVLEKKGLAETLFTFGRCGTDILTG